MQKLSALGLPLLFALLLTACGSNTESTSDTSAAPTPQINKVTYHPDSFVKDMEMAHNKADFLSHKVVAFDLDLEFGGRQRFDGTVTLTSGTGKLRLDMDDLVLVFDGDSVYQAPDTTEYRAARFDIFTWSYFFALPYKLNDPGVIWSDVPFEELDGKTYRSKKLAFEDGTGDSSLDWYIVYADPADNLIRYTAYIVTMYSKQEEAEEDPHAIGYSDYQEVEGIPVPMEWTFFGWRENEGLTDTLGHGQLSNVRFLEDAGTLFDRPAQSKVITYQRPPELSEE